MPVVYITSMADFESVVNDTRPVIIEFWAEWCVTCRSTTQLYDQLAAQNPAGQFYRLDIEEVREVPQALGVRNVSLATRLGRIMKGVLTTRRDQLPAFKVYVKGVQIGELVGADQTQLTVSRFFKDDARNLTPRVVI
ncbi:thioredoxin-like protein [Butyriboletus roseoflavus]|nr:thioredoxin-like protein [Butyriboletus roseoflavus]